VIVGGVTFSLILTLAILPVTYTLISRRKPKKPSALEKLAD
jgi:multidrug efflux pump subunit AcrB